MSDDLNHIVRSAFEDNSSEGAPNSIWSAIDTELTQNEVDVAVKDGFESQQGTAPELVWERVQNQLDIDRVWTRIADKIRIKKHGFVLRYACAVLVFMLPFALDYDFTVPEVSLNQNMTGQSSMENNSNLISNEVSPFIESSTFISPTIAQTGIDQNTHIITPDPSPIHVDEKPIDKELLLSDYLTVRPLVSLATSGNPQLQPLFSPKPKRSIGLIIGGVASLDNTWIIDNNTRTGFDSESLVDNEISLGSSYGAFAEYQLNRRYSISAEYFFQSRSKQHHHMYNNEGVYTHTEREINSYKLALMATRYTQPKFHGVSHSTLFRFGGYFSGVKSDFTYSNDVVTNVNSIYKRNDVGLRMEIGKRIYLNSFIIEGGVKGEYGLMNLASTKSYIPKHLNFTRLVSGGIYVRIGYAF